MLRLKPSALTEYHEARSRLLNPPGTSVLVQRRPAKANPKQIGRVEREGQDSRTLLRQLLGYRGK